jgi:hypothetical protein
MPIREQHDENVNAAWSRNHRRLGRLNHGKGGALSEVFRCADHLFDGPARRLIKSTTAAQEPLLVETLGNEQFSRGSFDRAQRGEQVYRGRSLLATTRSLQGKPPQLNKFGFRTTSGHDYPFLASHDADRGANFTRAFCSAYQALIDRRHTARRGAPVSGHT